MKERPLATLAEAVAELVRLTDQDIAAFEARMRQVTPTYAAGDSVQLATGEIYTIVRYETQRMPGYWLARPGDKLFVPIDMEKTLAPVLH